MNIHELYMQRCLQLAALGAGNVAPNPMVGAVLVHEQRIIGEGYHQQYGKAHAEVNCINSVAEADKPLIPLSTLYVSLEPCAHFGKTPPCTNLIIEKKIGKVVVGIRDPFVAVDGKGIEQLQNAGVQVIDGVLEKECRQINKRFFCFHTAHRPYIILKWAQTANGIIGSSTAERLLISDELTNRLVHKWRSEETAIMVGTNTALYDDPSLNLRWWKGNNPVRLVIDADLSLPRHLKIFNREQKTIVFNTLKHQEQGLLQYYQLQGGNNFIQQVLQACKQLQIQSILVEGGAKLLQSFIDEGSWDEARVITNTGLSVAEGLNAPVLTHNSPEKTETILTDRITYFANHVNNP